MPIQDANMFIVTGCIEMLLQQTNYASGKSINNTWSRSYKNFTV